MFERPFTFDRVIRIGISVLLIGLALYLIVVLRNALLPFLIAWFMAYMCQPFVRFFQYKLKFKSRILSILAVLLSVALILFLLTVMDRSHSHVSSGAHQDAQSSSIRSYVLS